MVPERSGKTRWSRRGAKSLLVNSQYRAVEAHNSSCEVAEWGARQDSQQWGHPLKVTRNLRSLLSHEAATGYSVEALCFLDPAMLLSWWLQQGMSPVLALSPAHDCWWLLTWSLMLEGVLGPSWWWYGTQGRMFHVCSLLHGWATHLWSVDPKESLPHI